MRIQFNYIKKRALPILMAVLFFLYSFFVTAEIYGLPSKDAYVSSGIGEARVLIPFFADDSISGSICGYIYNGLTKVDKDLNLVGDLAENWDVQDGGLSITFFLKKNVKWHDGEPFTAEDVYYTFQTILNSNTGCPYISSYNDIKNIEIIDLYTICFYYEQPYAPALLKFGMGIVPKHLFSAEKNIRNSIYARKPVGTGPYKFSEWKRGEYIILEANPNYFEHVPGIKHYVYRIIPDQAVQFLELISGGIDSMDLTSYQYLYRSDTEQFRENINKYSYLAHSYTYIGYNLKDNFLEDVRVRKALSYAIDKDELISAALFGLGESCTGPFFKGTPYCNENVEKYEYDPERAGQLLSEAGWIDSDNDGILEKDGLELSIMIATNQGNQAREAAATIVQRQWKKIGVNAQIMVASWSAFLDQFINKKNFQAVLLGWTLPPDPDSYSVWHSNSIDKGLNFISYSNRDVDELIERGRREFDPDKRKQIYNDIHELIAQDAPYTFLFFPYTFAAVQNRFKGIEPAPAGIGYNFTDWYVDDDDVRYKF
ncbi:MAG: peptide-binding protein [Candidatus Omnitrophota bacterium]